MLTNLDLYVDSKIKLTIIWQFFVTFSFINVKRVIHIHKLSAQITRFTMSSPSLPDVADDAAASSHDATITLDLLAKQSSVHGIGNLNHIQQPDRDNATTLPEAKTPSTVDMNRIAGLARVPFRKVTHCIFDLDGLLLGKFLRNVFWGKERGYVADVILVWCFE